MLKDAASASIYGSRAANGVIIITTKRGKDGKVKIDFDASVAMQTYAHKMEVLNAKEFGQVMWQGYVNDGLDPNSKADGNTYTIDTKGWYTNLEVFANSLVEDIMKNGNADGESNYEEYYPAYNKPVTAINTVRTTAIVSTEYYSLDGRRLEEPQKGVNIRIERMANGKTITTKVLK